MAEIYKMGWLPDYPDMRDYDISKPYMKPMHSAMGQKSIPEMLDEVGVTKSVRTYALPSRVDLRPWFPPVEDQESIGSCTANAGVGLVEYYENRAYRTYTDASRLFLYKVTRNLLGWTGDTGAFLRTTMGALALFGVPPEKYWKYIVADYDVEPSAFLYSFAQNYQAIQYYRLDPAGTTPATLLARIKLFLAAKLPSMFGFTVYSSISQARDDGLIPYPTDRERAIGGHAVVAAGYDNNKRIRNESLGGRTTRGALLIRNSWGTGWGERGYGWLPYEYVTRGLAVDWWALLKNEWVATKQFGLNT